MGFGEVEAVLAEPVGTFSRLSPGERRVLAGWIEAARSGGIDTAEDIGFRSWPGHGTETIIGIFKPGHMLASWLVVGHGGCWAVASCGDSAVSPRVRSLADALDLVYRRPEAAAS